ncbi:hypothetical protein [Mucilaginibacter psychrotolerans]|uniref:Uncharacterized protein n=1 Tax=Mucilaginibacter psychrotolerans TaxID=1524096 RepID=A0A4Y8S4C4_9SPHI|nr:hypothetical protein [Mucilaginibacter psychrotolerans]TFF33420.1 hypothetical protein E2R66_26165 [Mucilaginibacter psychrotolerans]
MKKNIAAIILYVCFTTVLKAQVNDHIVEPTGVYKEIKVEGDNNLVLELTNAKKSKRAKLIALIIAEPNKHNPVVLYALSAVLFKLDRKDEAFFWFYVAQLRTRYDFNRCTDKSTSGPVAQVNATFGPEINTYAFKNLDTLENIIGRVVAFVKDNNEEYDQRWLNLSGMDAFTNASTAKGKEKPLSLPESEWPAIKTKTIDSYYSDFKEALAGMRAKK